MNAALAPAVERCDANIPRYPHAPLCALAGGAQSFRNEMRNDSGHEVLLHDHDDHQNQRQNDAVDESTRQHRAFLAFQVGDRHTGRDVLRRNHFAQDSAG